MVAKIKQNISYNCLKITFYYKSKTYQHISIDNLNWFIIKDIDKNNHDNQTYFKLLNMLNNVK